MSVITMATVGAVHERGQVAPPIVAVDEHSDKEHPYAGDRPRLNRREHSAEDAAKYNRERDQAPQRLDHDLAGVVQRHHLATRMTVAIGHHQVS
jgi:hypothetical protein